MGAGIPCFYFCLLFKHRVEIAPGCRHVQMPKGIANYMAWHPRVGEHRRLHQEVHQLAVRTNNDGIKYLRFLYEAYTPANMYFEIIECARKLSLTGMLVFCFPDTPSQIIVGLVIAAAQKYVPSEESGAGPALEKLLVEVTCR